jgi:hypothetical protein
MQRYAALRQRERLVVTMLHQRDVRLVVHDSSEHIVCRDGHREPFTLTKCGDCFITAASLCQKYSRQRVNQRQMTTVTNGVQRGGRFRQMLADDAGIADLLVAKGKLVMRETNRTRVVCKLGVLQGSCVKGDRP